MSNEAWWYLMRAAGLTAWVLLTLTLVWGALISARVVPGARARRWLVDLHPYLGGVGLAALAAHLVGAVADSTVGMRWPDLLVPFASSWNPVGVALGVLALWCLAAVEATSLLRRRLAARTWHGIHLLSYVMAWLVTLHAVTAGTDTGRPVVAWGALALVAVSTIVGVVRAVRIPTSRDRAPAPPPTARPGSAASTNGGVAARRRRPTATLMPSAPPVAPARDEVGAHR